MYYDVPEHSLEESVVSPFFSDSLCVDFLRLSRDFGEEVTCGPTTPKSDLEPSRIQVEFRSNKSMRRPGFRMRVICFNPKTQNAQGCTVSGSRKKRASAFNALKMRQVRLYIVLKIMDNKVIYIDSC